MRPQESMIGDSAALAAALEHVSALAPINRPVLVLGERGTGKELVAQRLHYLSRRWEAPFIKVNCAAMADSLLESELFGHEPGAFTGASKRRHGRFERADEGTLFLDEIGTMSPRLQEKLLRLVEYGEFERVGGQETLQVDVRVIAATHADLRTLSDSGEFRADLLDRLSFDVVHLPALRQRSGDIPQLAEHFGLSMSAELRWDFFPGFSDGAMTSLESYAWPGNVRELKNAVERSLHRWGDSSKAVAEVVIDPFLSPYAEHEAVTLAESATTEASHSDTGEERTGIVTDFNAEIALLEKQLLTKALAKHDNNQKRTANALGLSYDQLRGMVRKYGLSKRTRRQQ